MKASLTNLQTNSNTQGAMARCVWFVKSKRTARGWAAHSTATRRGWIVARCGDKHAMLGGLEQGRATQGRGLLSLSLSLSLSLLVYLFSSLVWAGIFSFFKIHQFFSNFYSKIHIFSFLWIASACATPRNDGYFHSKRFQIFEKSHFKG